jgi:hypothetical protein
VRQRHQTHPHSTPHTHSTLPPPPTPPPPTSTHMYTLHPHHPHTQTYTPTPPPTPAPSSIPLSPLLSHPLSLPRTISPRVSVLRVCVWCECKGRTHERCTFTRPTAHLHPHLHPPPSLSPLSSPIPSPCPGQSLLGCRCCVSVCGASAKVERMNDALLHDPPQTTLSSLEADKTQSYTHAQVPTTDPQGE